MYMYIFLENVSGEGDFEVVLFKGLSIVSVCDTQDYDTTAVALNSFTPMRIWKDPKRE